MNTITATFRIVTPMFISGADQSTAEIRAPSIKGVLRFWWRALNWHRFANGQNNNQRESLLRLRRDESLLFGTADQAKGVGQSAILPQVECRHDSIQSGNEILIGRPSKYLGMGLFAMGSRSRNAGYPAPPAQTRTCGFPASGSSVVLASRKART
jgi:CRISPR-associated protein Cmr1